MGRTCRWRWTRRWSTAWSRRALPHLPADAAGAVPADPAVGYSPEHHGLRRHADAVERHRDGELDRAGRMRGARRRQEAAAVQCARRPGQPDGHRGARAARAAAACIVYSAAGATCRWARRWTGCSAPTSIASASMRGEIETSMMLALRPQLVDMAQARDFKSTSQAARRAIPDPGQRQQRQARLGDAGLQRPGRGRQRGRGHARTRAAPWLTRRGGSSRCCCRSSPGWPCPRGWMARRCPIEIACRTPFASHSVKNPLRGIAAAALLSLPIDGGLCRHSRKCESLRSLLAPGKPRRHVVFERLI